MRLSLLWYSGARRTQQEKYQQQVKSARASPLAFSSITSQPRNFSYSPEMARNAKCAYFVAKELGRAWRAAGERKQQVLSARASTLAVSPIADQPRRFSDSRKIAKNAKCAFCVAMALGRARQAEGETLIVKAGLPWWRANDLDQTESPRYVCVGCQLNSDQALRLFCLKGHVRACGSTL